MSELIITVYIFMLLCGDLIVERVARLWRKR